MPDGHTLILFTGAAVVLAIMPGPGLFYLTGRALAKGRAGGLYSCIGSTLGGLIHVVAAAAGVSAIVMASSLAFSALKVLGGLYLIYLAVQTWRTASQGLGPSEPLAPGADRKAFRQAAIVEAANPKTAAFFLALIPQFVDPAAGQVMLQFVVLGLISVTLNSMMGVLCVLAAAWFRTRVVGNDSLMSRLRKTSALILGGLGLSLIFTRRPV